MSVATANNAKADKAKKFQSLNINTLYQGSTPKPQQRSAPPKHGLQSLGKVPTARKAPANLPSLKAENCGNDPTVALVPAGGSGWTSGSLGKEDNKKPAVEKPDVAAEKPKPPVVVEKPSEPKTWGTMVQQQMKAQSSFLSQQSPLFGQEFPSLTDRELKEAALGSSALLLENVSPKVSDAKYGPGPVLRPQTSGNWMQRGGKSNGPSGESQFKQDLAIPHFEGSLVKPSSSLHGNKKASAAQSDRRNANNQRGGNNRGNRDALFQTTAIIDNEKLKQMDDFDNNADNDWTKSDDNFDYNKQLRSDDEDEEPEPSPSWNEFHRPPHGSQQQGHHGPGGQHGHHRQDGRLDSRAHHNQHGPGGQQHGPGGQHGHGQHHGERLHPAAEHSAFIARKMENRVSVLDEEEERRVKKNEEVLKNIERARKRREEEENKYKGDGYSESSYSYEEDSLFGAPAHKETKSKRHQAEKKSSFGQFDVVPNGGGVGQGVGGAPSGGGPGAASKNDYTSSELKAEKNLGISVAPAKNAAAVHPPPAPPRFKRNHGELQALQRKTPPKETHEPSRAAPSSKPGGAMRGFNSLFKQEQETAAPPSGEGASRPRQHADSQSSQRGAADDYSDGMSSPPADRGASDEDRQAHVEGSSVWDVAKEHESGPRDDGRDGRGKRVPQQPQGDPNKGYPNSNNGGRRGKNRDGEPVDATRVGKDRPFDSAKASNREGKPARGGQQGERGGDAARPKSVGNPSNQQQQQQHQQLPNNRAQQQGRQRQVGPKGPQQDHEELNHAGEGGLESSHKALDMDSLREELPEGGNGWFPPRGQPSRRGRGGAASNPATSRAARGPPKEHLEAGDWTAGVPTMAPVVDAFEAGDDVGKRGDRRQGQQQRNPVDARATNGKFPNPKRREEPEQSGGLARDRRPKHHDVEEGVLEENFETNKGRGGYDRRAPLQGGKMQQQQHQQQQHPQLQQQQQQQQPFDRDRRQNKLPPRLARQREQNKMAHRGGGGRDPFWNDDPQAADGSRPNWKNAPPSVVESGGVESDRQEHGDLQARESQEGSDRPVHTIIFENTNLKGNRAVIGEKGGFKTEFKSDGIHIPIGFGRTEDSADFRLDFSHFDSEINVEDNKMEGASKASGNPSTEDLNMKIASVKKVWEMPTLATMPGGMVDPQTNFSTGFHKDDVSLGSGLTAAGGRDQASLYEKSEQLNSSNVAKVRPQQQSQHHPGAHDMTGHQMGGDFDRSSLGRGRDSATAAAAYSLLMGGGENLLPPSHTQQSMLTGQPPSLYQAFQLDSRAVTNPLLYSYQNSMLLQSAGATSDLFGARGNHFQLQQQFGTPQLLSHQAGLMAPGSMKSASQIGPIGTKGGSSMGQYPASGLGSLPAAAAAAAAAAANSQLLIQYDGSGNAMNYMPGALQRGGQVANSQTAFYQALAASGQQGGGARQQQQSHGLATTVSAASNVHAAVSAAATAAYSPTPIQRPLGHTQLE